MTCRNCHQPIQRCSFQGSSIHGHRCVGGLGWIHISNGMHLCRSDDFLAGDLAEPEPATLPVTEAPTSKPQGEVA